MLSYHNDPTVKAFYLARVQTHHDADEIIKGTYWEDGKGCAVGCAVETGDRPHEEMAQQLGIPLWLSHLEDALFEALPDDQAKGFPVRFLAAIPVGVDLAPVFHRFMEWLLIDPRHGVARFADEAGHEVISHVAALHRRAAKGETVTDQEWSAARSAAQSAARRAAWSAARRAAWSAAERDAWSAAWSAAERDAWSAAQSAARSAAESTAQSAAWRAAQSAAQSAAWSAAQSAAWSAAERDAWRVMADQLVMFLATAGAETDTERARG